MYSNLTLARMAGERVIRRYRIGKRWEEFLGDTEGSDGEGPVDFIIVRKSEKRIAEELAAEELPNCSRINRGCEDVVGDTNGSGKVGPVKKSSPIIDSNENSWIIDVEYGVPWPGRTSCQIGSHTRDEDKSDKDSSGSKNESKESSTVCEHSEEDDTETDTYVYAGDSDSSDDDSSYQESNMCDGGVESDGEESDRSYLEIGLCDNCDGRGPSGCPCYTCEDSGFIYG